MSASSTLENPAGRGQPSWSAVCSRQVAWPGIPFRHRARARGLSAADQGYRPLVWLACNARDRFRLYRKARRAANAGTIVISDRYPHPLLISMDVPQIARLTDEGARSRLVRRLIQIEEGYHCPIVLPELVIVLRLKPEVAAARKTDEPYEYVLERSGEVWDVDWSESGLSVVDASQAPAEVVRRVKELIWSSLS